MLKKLINYLCSYRPSYIGVYEYRYCTCGDSDRTLYQETEYWASKGQNKYWAQEPGQDFQKVPKEYLQFNDYCSPSASRDAIILVNNRHVDFVYSLIGDDGQLN